MVDVMSRFAWALGRESPTEAHYKLSTPVPNIDAFISHNWSTPQRDKFLALALHFNWSVAAAAALTAGFVGFALTLARVLPLVDRSAVSHADDKAMVVFRRGVWSQVFGMTALVTGLAFGQDVARLFRCSGPMVFLDRTCVSQTDPYLKQRGIESLAAFLANSQSMVVLYSDTYLRKLWTVYEVATFLFLFPTGQLVFQPVIFPKVVLSGMVFVTLTRISFMVVGLKGVQENAVAIGIPPIIIDNVLSYLLLWPWFFGLTAMMRWWAKEQARIRERLKDFTIRDAVCYCENDRRAIETNVAVFAIHFGLVGPDAQQEDALAEFDAMIHREVPRLLLASLGPTGIPYRSAAAMFSIYFFFLLDLSAAALIEDKKVGPSAMAIYGNLLYCFAVMLGVGPLVVALDARLSRRLREHNSKVSNVLVACVVFLCYALSVQVMWTMTRPEFPWMLASGSAGALAPAALVCVVYQPWRKRAPLDAVLHAGPGTHECCETEESSSLEGTEEGDDDALDPEALATFYP